MTMTVHNGEVSLALHVHGEGPTLLLLHGWPDTSALWNDVVPDLVAAGYRVAVPDLRGAGESSKPLGVERYTTRELVEDVVAIIEALGEEPVTLVGHDWGANLAWVVAVYLPHLVERLVVLSLGHPSAFRSAGLEQQIKSWYMLLFYHEGVGEAFLRKNNYEAMRQWLGHPHVEAIIVELERNGQMSAHLKWYRANVAPDAFVTPPRAMAPVEVPVLGLWSSGDRALIESQMTNSALYCAKGFTYVRLENVGHWLPLEAPHQVSREVLAFCSLGR